MATLAATPKGVATRDLIVERAYQQVRLGGFEGLSIGGVASAVSMSKSGVFAHFGSREELQRAVLEAGVQHFIEAVFRPALRERRGLPRLLSIMRRTLEWMSGSLGGCPMVSAAIEYDDRPGAIRDAVAAYQKRLRSELVKAIGMAVETGELRDDTDADQLAFEFFAIELAVHHDSRLFDKDAAVAHGLRAVDRLLASART
ncbi:MAG TPA: TetR/AcrR family transcriptional regulator [Dokdonella sp.]